MNKNALQIGINLGGWLSQYPAYDRQHFKTFISADDIKRIADWGMDHVRLPVDHPVLKDGFSYVETCLDWCEQNGLRVIIDLHKAPGYSFDALKEASLFQDASLQERFVGLWQTIAQHFAGQMEDTLAFELLNEIVLPDSGPWNALVAQTMARIRALDSQRLILVGGNRYNAPDELSNLKILDDPNILYTFHFYSPMTVTHQKAPWVPVLVKYDQSVEYPGEAPSLGAFLEQHPDRKHMLEREIGAHFDKNYLHAVLQPALDFSQQTGQMVYCGEFGVYERAAMSTRLNWLRDLISLLNEFGIGRAYWTYKAMDFGLVDKDGNVVSRELIEVISQR